jgi:hypothetical protein
MGGETATPRSGRGEYLPVVTVSRRTDMPGWYAEDLVRILEARHPPGTVHSLVIMTKFPHALLRPPLTPLLSRYDQVVVQVTITGLGGSPLEPRVPPFGTALEALPRLIELTGSPDRVTVRIDPIVHWRRASVDGGDSPTPHLSASAPGHGGGVFSNQPLFLEIASRAREAGVGSVKTSLVSPYTRVVRRLRRAGLELVSLAGPAREEVLGALEADAAAARVSLEYCCEEIRSPSACVDVGLLTRLHPGGLPARPGKAAGQRTHCGCSPAVDIAWYSTHPCPSGCLYFYANPVPTGRVPAPPDGKGCAP